MEKPPPPTHHPRHEVDAPEPMKVKGALSALFALLSSFGLASVLLLLLTVLTLFGTLEQKEFGLFVTAKKYFSSEAFIVFPELYGRKWPLPLPGAFWVSALLFVNMVCGGLVRARKGWKKVGVLISHFGILMMLFGGAITHFASTRGAVKLFPGEESDATISFTDYTVEVAELADGQPEKIYSLPSDLFKSRGPNDPLTAEFSELPFDLEIQGWQHNAVVQQGEGEGRPGAGPSINGFYLQAIDRNEEIERDFAGAYLRVVTNDGEKRQPFISTGRDAAPKTVKVDDRTFSVRIRKEIRPLPFMVKLEDFDYAYHAGTLRPKFFKSVVKRTHPEDGTTELATIRMNRPMRYDGYTFFQASFGHLDEDPQKEAFSIFEVVNDPADAWPAISLVVVTIGLGIHFVMMLERYLRTASRRLEKEKSAKKEATV